MYRRNALFSVIYGSQVEDLVVAWLGELRCEFKRNERTTTVSVTTQLLYHVAIVWERGESLDGLLVGIAQSAEPYSILGAEQGGICPGFGVVPPPFDQRFVVCVGSTRRFKGRGVKDAVLVRHGNMALTCCSAGDEERHVCHGLLGSLVSFHKTDVCALHLIADSSVCPGQVHNLFVVNDLERC